MHNVILFAQAVVPSELQSSADNIEAGWQVVKLIVASVVVFGIMIGYIKMLHARWDKRDRERGNW